MESKTFKKAALAIALAQCVTGVAVAYEGGDLSGENNTVENVDYYKNQTSRITATETNTVNGTFSVSNYAPNSDDPKKPIYVTGRAELIFDAKENNVTVSSGKLSLNSHGNVKFLANKSNVINVENGNIIFLKNDQHTPGVSLEILAKGDNATNTITANEIEVGDTDIHLFIVANGNNDLNSRLIPNRNTPAIVKSVSGTNTITVDGPPASRYNLYDLTLL